MRKLLLIDMDAMLSFKGHESLTFTLPNPADTVVLNNLIYRKNNVGKSYSQIGFDIINHWYFRKRGEDTIETLSHELSKIYELSSLRTGCKEFLIHAKQNGHIIYLCGAGSVLSAEYIVDKFGLQDFFDSIITLQQVNKDKPSPDIYLQAMMLADVDKTECLVFEESYDGMLASSRAGIDYVRMYSEESPKVDISALDRKAIALIRDFSDPILKGLVE